MEASSEERSLVLDPQPTAASATPNDAGAPVLVWSFALLVCGGIAIYAFTRAFVWDEGFHVVAAQMILAGKKPYLDFCFPQTPLNIYWNAGWMRFLGQSWRVSHITATLELAGATLLLARYLLTRFADLRWRTACALAGVAFFGVNVTLVQFGPIAQAYAICAFALLAAFIAVANAGQRPGLWRPFAGGLAIGCGAASSLLVAPALLVLMSWLWLRSENGSRLAKVTAFAIGAAIPFAPVLWLFAQAPHQTFFNIVQYQAIFRRADWKPETAYTHDFDVLTAWFDCGQILLWSGCTVAAALFIRRHKELDARFRSDYWLAFWIAAVLIAYISLAHPTFSRYFIVGMPLYAIVAAPGVMVLGSRIAGAAKPLLSAAVLIALLLFGLLRGQVNNLDGATWQRYQQISAAIAKVTPPNALLFADEQVYFLLHRLPPPGMEFSYSHKVDVPPKEAALLHIIPMKELKSEVTAGRFATLETCDDDKIDDWNLATLYKQRKDFDDCSIFWEFQKPH